MNRIKTIKPSIRTSHHYVFNGHLSESSRIGYCYAFHLFDGGKGYVTVEDRRYNVHKGTLFFIPPGRKHAFHTSAEYPLTSYNIYCELWSQGLDTNVHLAFHEKDFDIKYAAHTAACPELDDLPDIIPLQQFPYMTELFANIVNVNKQTWINKNEIACSLLYGWILQLCGLLVSPRPVDYRIQRIIDLMEQHPGNHPQYENWLEMSRLHKSQFYDLFKQTTGLSPKAYMIKIKMRQAQAMLLESNQSVTAIAEALGYSSIHYFSKQFTEYYGISPSVYRNRL